jgi:hypothetical protein
VDEQKKMEFDMAKDGTSVLKVLMAPWWPYCLWKK